MSPPGGARRSRRPSSSCGSPHSQGRSRSNCSSSRRGATSRHGNETIALDDCFSLLRGSSRLPSGTRVAPDRLQASRAACLSRSRPGATACGNRSPQRAPFAASAVRRPVTRSSAPSAARAPGSSLSSNVVGHRRGLGTTDPPPAQSSRPAGRRPSAPSFSRCARIASPAAGRSCAGTSDQAASSSSSVERRPAASAATKRRSRSCR